MPPSSIYTSARHVLDCTTDGALPPPPKRRRLNATQQEESECGARYEGPITLGDSSRAIIGDVYETHNHIQPASPVSEEARSKQLVESLKFKMMDARLHNVKAALKNTCQWLFRHQAFRAWMDDTKLSEHKGFLWIKGKPGCGKSTLMKGAYSWAKTKSKKQWITLSYFFNARAPGALEKSPLGLYRSLVHEILRAVPQSVSMFDEMFSCKSLLETIDWTPEELQDFLVRFVDAAWRPPVVIFVDALDEGNDSDIRALISFLEDLIDHSNSGLPLRICLSSRHYPHITIKNGLSLVVEKQCEHDRDIEKYVHDKLFDDTEADMAGLRATICARAASIFLWVVLVVPILNRLHDQGSSVANMTVYLEKLPKDLEGLFAEILARDPVEVRACVALLQWVLYSYKPLNSVELYLAIQHSWPRADGDIVTTPSNTALAKYILHHSRGLVEVTKFEPPVVQFIHETVREFLAGDRGLAQVDMTLASNLPGWSHARLAQTCFSYFIQNCSKSILAPLNVPSGKQKAKAVRENVVKESAPFLPYAVANLLVHAEAAQSHRISQGTLLECLCTIDGVLDPSFLFVHNLLEEHEIRRYHTDVTLLYVLAEKGFPALVTILLKLDSPPINKTCGRYGTALQAACYGGNEEIVQSLLHHGADVNAVGGEYRSALGAVVASRRFRLFHALRKHGLSETAVVSNKALYWLRKVDWKAHSDIKELFDNSIGPHLNWEYVLSTCLYPDERCGLVINNQEYVLESFMENLAQMENSIVDFGVDALLLASSCGHGKTVQVLLAEGVGINCQRGFGKTALHHASLKGQLKVVQYLLDSGAEINILDNDNKSALHYASSKGQLKVVQTLLDRGAKINALDNYNQSALHWASRNGHREVVRTLLDRGAEINTLNNYNDSALHLASRNSHREVVRTLLDRGAEINALDNCNQSALHWASWGGHVEVVQMLLDRGAEINALDNDNESALHGASRDGHAEVVQMLLDRGAEINARNNDKESALHGASWNGHVEVVQTLLDRGANVDLLDYLGKTALHRASICDHLEVVQLLTERGAEFS